MDSTEYKIKEAKLARAAYHIALIPFLGIPLYLITAAGAVLEIGRGRTGFTTLYLGFVRLLRMHLIYILALATIWFFPQASVDIKHSSDFNLSYYSQNVESRYLSGKGYVTRTFEFPPRHRKIFTWIYSQDKVKCVEVSYSLITSDAYHEKSLSGNDIGEWSLTNAGEEKYVYWYSNGQKRAEGASDKKRNLRTWTYWYDNGQKEFEGYSDDKGVCQGAFSEWYKNGKVRVMGRYLSGEHDGQWKTYYDNGQIKSETNFLAGAWSGKWRFWSKDGTLQKEKEWSNVKPERKMPDKGFPLLAVEE